MVHLCKNDDIVVVVDGDDWLKHPNVLKDLNQYYENENVWMTYGQYIRHPDGQVGMCAPVSKTTLNQANFRSKKWMYSHLRTFYAGLFKRVKLEDLLFEGTFFDTTYDLAIMYPMLEMAREHAYFTQDISYVYNYENPLNDAKLRLKEQEKIEGYIRGLQKYPKLNVHPATNFGTHPSDQCDLVIFSFNRPMQLYSLLESVRERVTGLRKIMVIYRQDKDFFQGYEIVKKTFPNVDFYKQSDNNPYADFKPLVLQTAFSKKRQGAEYILFAVDDLIITDHIIIKEGIKKLQSTGTYGLYYRIGTHTDYCYTADFKQGLPNFLELGNDCLAWQFDSGKGDWDYPNSVDFVLYKKQDIQQALEQIDYVHPNYLEGKWALLADHKKMGICYTRAKTVNIPINKVTTFSNKHANMMSPEEMNTEFLKGFKIDIKPIFQLNNRSAHTEIEPDLIPR